MAYHARVSTSMPQSYNTGDLCHAAVLKSHLKVTRGTLKVYLKIDIPFPESGN